MKKQFFFLTSLLIIAFYTTHAQKDNVGLTEKLNNSEEHLAKAAVDLVVMQNFFKNFTNVSNDSWAKTGNGYLVSFYSNDILYNVFLNKKGKMTSQIRYYSESNLPEAVQDQIKSIGGCFSVGSVREITTKNSTAYLISISDATSWKVIRVVGDEFDVFEEYKKS